MMDDQPHRRAQSVQKQGLGGIKFSDEQVRLVFGAPAGSSGLSRLLACFAAHRINLHQIVYSESPPSGAEFYLARRDYLQYQSLIGAELGPSGLDPARVDEPAGTLTLFPHGSRMEVLLKVLETAGRPGLGVYGMCSSLSALCISAGAARLDSLAEALLENFCLPRGHSPFRYEPSELDRKLTGGHGRIVETIARYWEPVIRIYGSSLKTGLARCLVSSADERFQEVIDGLAGCRMSRFELMGLSRTGAGRFFLELFVDPEYNPGAVAAMRDRFDGRRDLELSVREGLELLFFHGPHFQDRYGVMHAAVSALAKASIETPRATCSGTGVHLVADPGEGRRMREVLGKVFVVP